VYEWVREQDRACPGLVLFLFAYRSDVFWNLCNCDSTKGHNTNNKQPSYCPLTTEMFLSRQSLAGCSWVWFQVYHLEHTCPFFQTPIKVCVCMMSGFWLECLWVFSNPPWNQLVVPGRLLWLVYCFVSQKNLSKTRQISKTEVSIKLKRSTIDQAQRTKKKE
jgi:hypothetical protein